MPGRGTLARRPLALLGPVIAASSNESDVVLDPFCGRGTMIDAARRLERNWVGIDISAFAIDLVRNRRLRDPTIPTRGIRAVFSSGQSSSPGSGKSTISSRGDGNHKVARQRTPTEELRPIHVDPQLLHTSVGVDLAVAEEPHVHVDSRATAKEVDLAVVSD